MSEYDFWNPTDEHGQATAMTADWSLTVFPGGDGHLDVMLVPLSDEEPSRTVTIRVGDGGDASRLLPSVFSQIRPALIEIARGVEIPTAETVMHAVNRCAAAVAAHSAKVESVETQ